MAVHVPVLLVTSALRALELRAKSQNTEADKELVRLKIQSEMMTRKMGLQANLLDRQEQREAHFRDRALEREAQMLDRQRDRELVDRQQERQVRIATELANMARDMSAQKVSAVLEIFHGVKEVLLTHMTILGQEKAALHGDGSSPLDGAQYALRRKRQKEIDRELAEVSAAAMNLGETAQQVIAKIEQSIPQSIMIELQRLKDVTPR